MEAIESKLASKAFHFIGGIYLIFDMDFTKDEIDILRKKGWGEYRQYWHSAPKGWSPPPAKKQ